MSWSHFKVAPHRMMFFNGAIQTLLPMLFWLWELLARYGFVLPIPLEIPANSFHLFVMLYGVVIFFIFGFLMTTYPRWLRGKAIEEKQYLPVFWVLTSGWVLFYISLFISKWFIFASVLIILAGWIMGLNVLWNVFRKALSPNKIYETYLNAALICGGLGMLSFAIWLLTEQSIWLNLSKEIGIWLFLVPVIFTVSLRMIPFFSSVVLMPYKIVQPLWCLPFLAVAVFLHASLSLLGLSAWLFLVDLPFAGMVFYLSYQWQFKKSFNVRILAVLHVAFLVLGISLVLYSAQSIIWLISKTWILDKAPLHTLTIGCIGSILVAMASRVTLGHSGRPLFADSGTWWSFWGLQFTAIIRIFSELDISINYWFVLLAAISWLGFFGVWFIKYALFYWQPRADGQAG
ncbi:MAG: hypothetical protein RIT27_2417 [Pseudomonadota bacterium]|jgi:uncharacterized protein involved in response to NO